MRMKGIALACAMLALLGAPAAHAGVFADKLSIKAGVIGVLPDEDADIGVIGGTVDISDEYVPAVQIEYKLSDRWQLELLCCVAPHEVTAVQTAAGAVDLGEVTLFPPTLTLKYRFETSSGITPYLGAGVNYTHFFDESLPAGGAATAIDYDDSFGPAVQAGVDFEVNDRWFFNADVKKIWIQPDVTIQAGATRIPAAVDIDPWVVGVGFGYRF